MEEVYVLTRALTQILPTNFDVDGGDHSADRRWF
jgi:hypothetical protein